MMFAKLKKKIEEEQQNSDQRSPALSSVTASPSSSSISNFSGSENASPVKTPSTRSSQESPSTHDQSETQTPPTDCPTNAIQSTPQKQTAQKVSQPAEPNSKVLQQKTEHIQMLETKVKDLTQQVTVEHKRCLLLQVELQQSSQSHERRERELLTRIESLYKTKTDSDQRLQDCRSKMDRLIEQQDSKEELEGFRVQELAKVKHLLLASQQEFQIKEEELKGQSLELNGARDQLKNLDAEVQRLRDELSQSQLYLSQQASLQEEVDRLKQEALKAAQRVTQLEKTLSDLIDEHDALKHTHQVYKSKSSSILDEKDTSLAHLQDRLGVLENRLKDAELGGDDRLQAVISERHVLEKKLEESHQHLSEVKTTWSEKIHSLETQIFHLNKKMAEDSEECTNLEGQVETLRQKVRTLEEQNWKSDEQLQETRRQTEKLQNAKNEVESTLKHQLEKEQLEHTRLEEQLTKTTKENSKEKQDMQQRINELVSSQTEQVEKAIEAERQLTQLEDDNKRLKTDLSKKEKEVLLLQQKCSSSEERFSVAEAKLERLDSECSQSAIEIQERSKQLKQKEQHLQTVSEERDRLMLRNAELSQQLELVRRELEEETLAKEKESQETQLQVTQLQEDLAKATLRVSELERQASDQDNSNHRLTEQNSQINRLEDELAEKNKTIKLQQQRLNDMKKTFKRELRSQTQPNTDLSAGDELVVNNHTEHKNLEDINFRYLRHVVFKFMTSPEYEAQHLIRAVSVLLQFTQEEEKFIRETLEWKSSWFGSKPQPANDLKAPPVYSVPR